MFLLSSSYAIKNSFQDADAPFPHVFTETGMPVIMWIVTIGAIFALCTSLLGAMFPLPRVLYAMGTDGVLFRSLAAINARTRTPLLATVVSGLFSGQYCPLPSPSAPYSLCAPA